MRIVAKGVRTTFAGFLLTALVVIGGMTWATIATIKLAKQQVDNQYAANRNLALRVLDGYMNVALGAEQAVPPTHYRAFRPPDPDLLWKDGVPVDRMRFKIRSPLFGHRPKQHWIDLHFQIDPEGIWSSPQIADEADRRLAMQVTHGSSESAYFELIRSSFFRLKNSLQLMELQNQVHQALMRNEVFSQMGEVYGPLPEDTTITTSDPATESRMARRDKTSDLRSRVEQANRLQKSQMPRQTSLPMRIDDPIVDEDEQAESMDPDQIRECDVAVSIKEAPISAFWLNPTGTEAKKLVFVRTGLADGQKFYQGFVADWNTLKDELLECINRIFPKAELEPAPEDITTNRDAMQLALAAVPAVLTGEGINPPDAWEAWRSLSEDSDWRVLNWVLYASWVGALAVLVLAGWGLFSLVGVSARRMEFAYAVTHELRTPLTTFRLYTDMLSAGLVPEEKHQEYLDTLNREAGRLSGLVEDVLEYARLENHRVRLNPTKTDGEKLLEMIAADLRTRCQQAGIEPQTQNDIPTDRTFSTDLDLVHQITNVLVNNACRHAVPDEAPAKKSKPAVLVHLVAANGHLQVNVIDSGPGIDRSDAHGIFKPFRRGKRADVKAHGGIGLGLALARSWASLLGGKLELAHRHHPTYGGAHFRLTLPTEIKQN